MTEQGDLFNQPPPEEPKALPLAELMNLQSPAERKIEMDKWNPPPPRADQPEQYQGLPFYGTRIQYPLPADPE